MTRANLFTEGGEFLLPNGEEYVGPYHIHIDRGAMVGASHRSSPHDSLTPLGPQVEAMVESIQQQLRSEQVSRSTPPERSTPASSY